MPVKATTAADCGAHFYLTPADEGKNRAEACARQMQELNPGVKVGALAGAFPMEGLAQYQVVVAVDAPLDLALAVDAACRAASPPIAFIRTDVRGLCGAVFVDLGPSFVCHDPTGEAIKSAIVESVTVEGAGTDGAKLRVQVTGRHCRRHRLRRHHLTSSLPCAVRRRRGARFGRRRPRHLLRAAGDGGA